MHLGLSRLDHDDGTQLCTHVRARACERACTYARTYARTHASARTITCKCKRMHARTHRHAHAAQVVSIVTSSQLENFVAVIGAVSVHPARACLRAGACARLRVCGHSEFLSASCTPICILHIFFSFMNARGYIQVRACMLARACLCMCMCLCGCLCLCARAPVCMSDGQSVHHSHPVSLEPSSVLCCPV